MWDDLVRNLARYPTAVLTVTDGDAYPFSIRCEPRPDADREVLAVDVPGYVGAREGPAGLLCHVHDDDLWNMRNFVAHGGLERDGEGWVLRVHRVIEGAAPRNSVKSQLRPRASAKRYLERRGMDWPDVPWDRLHAIYRRARHDAETSVGGPGQLTERAGRMAVALLVDRPAADVFAVVSDLRNDPAWRREWVDARMEADGGVSVGSQTVLVGRALGRPIEVVYEVTELRPNRLVAWRGLSGPLRLRFSRTVEDVGGRARITFAYELPGRLGRLLRPVLGPVGRRQLVRDLPALQELLGASPSDT